MRLKYAACRASGGWRAASTIRLARVFRPRWRSRAQGAVMWEERAAHSLNDLEAVVD